jgi:glycosyltransferase involved in cell wall biosynthesis
MKRTLHFVYAGDPLNDGAIQTPATITNHIFRALEKDFDVRYYDWQYTGPYDVGPEDIVLGHPHWVDSTIIQRIFRQHIYGKPKPAARYLIFPFHHGIPGINLPFNELVMDCNKYFAITGEYWFNTIYHTLFQMWPPKMIHLNNALDVSRFPYLRQTFHDPGKRTLFYIGRDGVEKGSAQLAELARCCGWKLYYAGSINMSLFQGVDLEYLGFINLVEYAPWIVEHCDFFVNMSVSDANPTTIMEMAAIGLPVLATKESGYGPDLVSFHLELNGMDHNLLVLDELQNLDDIACPLKWARGARANVEKTYTWENFLAPILAELEQWK